MSKTYKGWELMKAIANGDIKNGSKFRDLHQSSKDNFNLYKYENENLKGRFGGTNLIALLNDKFELIEDEIDIDSIEKLDDTCYIMYGMQDEEIETYHNKTRTTMNEILQAVKQIDKRVKKLEKK